MRRVFPAETPSPFVEDKCGALASGDVGNGDCPVRLQDFP